jgi:hypothetical protein
MKAVLSQYTNHNGTHSAFVPSNERDSVWTNTPNTINRLRVDMKPGEFCLNLGINGLNQNNYRVSIAGNFLVIVLEKKREFVSSNSWQNSNRSIKTEGHTYTLYERSDVFLPGNNLKFLKSVRYENSELIVRIAFKN